MELPTLSFSDFFHPLSPPNFDCNIHFATPQSPVSPSLFVRSPPDQIHWPQNNSNNDNNDIATTHGWNPEELTNISDTTSLSLSTIESPKVDKNDEQGNKFCCLTCSKSFTAKRNLLRHNREQHETSNHPCLICTKTFSRKDKLTLHLYSHLSKSELISQDVYFEECEVCPKLFFEPGAYRRHVSSHSNIKSYSCHLCSAKYTQNYTLQRHLKRQHSDSTSLPVEE